MANPKGSPQSKKRPKKKPRELSPEEQQFVEMKAAARAQYGRQTMDAGQIAEAFTSARRSGGMPKHAAQNIKLSKADDAALAAAYISHMYSQFAGDAGKAKTGEDSRAAHSRDNIENYVASSTDADFRKQWEHLAAQEAYQQAIMEKKAKLLVSRLYIIYSDPTDPSGGFASDPTQPRGKNLKGYLEKLQGNLEGDDAVKLMFDVANFAALDKGVCNKQNVVDFQDKLRDYHQKYLEQIEKKFTDEPDAAKKNKLIEEEQRKANFHFQDVLQLIEDNRTKRRKDRKADSEYLLKEIICDENALIFHMGSGFLIRHSSGKFTCVGGTREEWGQMAMMAMKYLQDRGDPWRALVEIDGSPEFRNYIRAVFRQNSIRMAETGHTEAFLLSEIMKDVIQDYRYNLGRGYAVVRTIKCDEYGKPIIMMEDDGKGGLKPVTRTLYKAKDGRWVHPEIDRMSPDALTGETKEFPVPETVERLVWDKHKTAMTDTPEPMGPAYNCEVNKYGLKLPTEKNNSFVKAWAMGGDTGDYCLCGSFVPENPDTGTIPDETIHEMRLHNLNDMLNFKELCKTAQIFDYGMMGDDPAARMTNLMGRLAVQAKGSNDNIDNALGASDFMSDPNNVIREVEQRDFKTNGDKAASLQNSQANFDARKQEAAQKAANMNVDAGGMAMGF